MAKCYLHDLQQRILLQCKDLISQRAEVVRLLRWSLPE